MNAPKFAQKRHITLPSLEEQASALHAYIVASAPRFSIQDAIGIASRVQITPDGDPKVLAKKLAVELKALLITVKHTNTLQAVSRMMGHSSWHTNADDHVKRLKFDSMDVELIRQEEFRSWDELATELRSWADRLLARGQLPLGVLTLKFYGQVIHISTPVPQEGSKRGRRNADWPLAGISSAVEDPLWLEGAPAAFEKLRRHLEESGKAVLDGYAVLRLCADNLNSPYASQTVTTADVMNSELVLLRQDNEDDPHSSFEVARGDELTCWHQLDLSMRPDGTNVTPHFDITIPAEGSGAWMTNGARYVWAVETLKPKDYTPGLVHREIGISDCEKLLRRYKLAKQIHAGGFRHHDAHKTVDYLSRPPQDYRIRGQYLLQQLQRAGFTWESYVAHRGEGPTNMPNTLSTEFVYRLIEDLKLEEPNKLFAVPNLSEMVKVDNDGFIRALMPRVNHISYSIPKALQKDQETTVKEALELFGDGLRAQLMMSRQDIEFEHELPYLLWASEPEELRSTLSDEGFVLYAAVIPHLTSTKGIIPPEMLGTVSPWAYGNSLYLRIEHAHHQTTT